MSDRAAPRVDISIGDVHHSQLVVGDHNTIQTPDGTEVTVLQVGERPVPKLRRLPISRRPSAAEILGREDELDLIAASSAGTAIQLYAPDGAGKTSVLKLAAQRASGPAEGVAYESARHRSLDEIEAGLYAAFWECDIPFIPAPSEFDDFLADREALLILDDCSLDRNELETLLDCVPRCTVVLASQARTLWSRGTARSLTDLDPFAAVGLLERELGRSLDPDEREAAEIVVARLGGNPQSLVETAALVEDGRSSLRELADDPAALERRFDPSALTDSQKRILEVLSALDGAALGVEHVATVAGVGEAGEALRELERRGWAKAGSPRYRSTRPLPPEAVGSSHEEIAKPLLGHLTAWSGKAEPGAVAEEAEAIERALELGAAAERWGETLALTMAAERGLMVAGAWSSCRRVLRIGLRAAALVGSESDRAYVLHQLGSQSLCLGDRAEAADQLTEALQVRERLGEQRGAELTRHNLRQLRGGGDGGGEDGGDGGSGPPRPRMAVVLTVLAVVAAGVVGGLALAGGDGRNAAEPNPTTTTTPSPGSPPAIVIDSPEEGEVIEKGDTLPASFYCIAAEDAEIDSCQGVVDGAPVRDGGPLDTSAGDHRLVVVAIDKDGRKSRDEVSYSVSESANPPEVPPPGARPKIVIDSPEEGAVLKEGATLKASFDCIVAEDAELESCRGVVDGAPVRDGGPLDTSAGDHRLVVTAVDGDGLESSEEVKYNVKRSPPPEVDEDPPEISIDSPAAGKYVLGDSVGAAYTCHDQESEPVTCQGFVDTEEVENEKAIDMKTEGRHEFTVIATDSLGNKKSKTVEYEVIPPEEKKVPPKKKETDGA